MRKVESFKFCPMCGNALDDSDSEGGAYCKHCDRSWYRNSAPTAGCVLVRDGKALVTVRGTDPERGRIDVPGGFLAAGEEPIAGLKREIAEELGVEIESSIEDCISMVPHLYGDRDDYVLSIGFRARLVSGEPSPDSDVEKILWVGVDELDGLDFAWPHDRELVRRALTDG